MKLKLNKTFMLLIGLAALVMVILAIYEIFLKPVDTETSTDVVSINTYFGEDVLQFLKAN